MQIAEPSIDETQRYLTTTVQQLAYIFVIYICNVCWTEITQPSIVCWPSHDPRNLECGTADLGADSVLQK